MYSQVGALTFLLLELSLFGLFVYFVYLQFVSWVNETELHTPGLIKSMGLTYEWNNQVPMIILLFAIACILVIFLSAIWPATLSIAAVMGSAMYLRGKKRKEKQDENS